MERLIASQTVASIPELLRLIIGELELDQKSLARLACVSSTFHEISIPFLWSGMYQGVPDNRHLPQLLKLLPKALLDSAKPGSGLPVLVKAPQDSDWDPIRRYSIHTVALDLGLCGRTTPAPSYRANRVAPFFPRLNSLKLSVELDPNPQSLGWILLAGSSLRKLRVCGYGWGEMSGTLMGFYQHISTHATGIQHLHLHNFPVWFSHLPAELPDAFASMLHGLPQLQSFSYTSESTLPQPVLRAIATHPSLTDLDLSPHGYCPAMADDVVFFPSLRRIELTCQGAAGLAFMQWLSRAQLLSVVRVQSFPAAPDGAPFQPSLNTIPQIFQLSSSVTSVTLYFNSRLLGSWSQLRPLLNCRSISKMEVGSCDAVSGFDNTAVRDLASSWLHLEELAIAWTKSPYVSTEVSLFGLMPLAELTPKLRTLRLTFTTQVSDLFQVNSLMRFHRTAPSSLRQFDVHDSDINVHDDSSGTPTFLGAQKTARAIKNLWPSLESGVISRETVYAPGWRHVNVCMADLGRSCEQ